MTPDPPVQIDAAKDRMASLLAQIWQRNQPQVLERLLSLDQAVTALQAEALTASLREEAIATAHKLAGTLGMFGFPQGTALARDLEQAFDADELNARLITRLVQQLRATLFPS